MKTLTLCTLLATPLFLSVALTTPTPLHAQSDEAHESAKVLMIQREFTKPGRDGAAHEATEAAYIRAAQAGHAKFHYVALNSLTGPSRAIFVSSYPSFEAMEAEHKSIGASLSAALDKAGLADGEQLAKVDSSIWLRRDELSTNVSEPPVGTRVMEVTEFVVKPGHVHEFSELGKMYVKAAKDIPEMHWTTYEMAYGSSTAPTFIVLTALKSGSEIDAEFAAGKRFDEALSTDDKKKMAGLESSSILSEQTNVFIVNPKMSLPTDDMVKAEPNFWKPKTASATAKKPAAAKPAASGQ